MRFARIFLMICAAIFAFLGLACLFFPGEMASKVGIVLSDTMAKNDFRAFYGGFEIGIAAFLVVAIRESDFLVAGVWVNVCLFAGLAVGRLLSFVADGLPGALGLSLFFIELLGLLVGVLALRAVQEDSYV